MSLPGPRISATPAQNEPDLPPSCLPALQLPQAWQGRDQWRVLCTRWAQGHDFFGLWQAWLTDAKRPSRLHIRLLALALEIEKHHTKEEIMRLYADRAYFGRNLHGLKNACEHYFNRIDCQGLTLDEAAYLVGLVKALG